MVLGHSCAPQCLQGVSGKDSAPRLPRSCAQQHSRPACLCSEVSPTRGPQLRHFSPSWLSTFSLLALPLVIPLGPPRFVKGQELCSGLLGKDPSLVTVPGLVHLPLTQCCPVGRTGPGQRCQFLPAACTVAESEPRLAVTFGSACCPTRPPWHLPCASALQAAFRNLLPASSLAHTSLLPSPCALSMAFNRDHAFTNLKVPWLYVLLLSATVLSHLSSGTRHSSIQPSAHAIPMTQNTVLCAPPLAPSSYSSLTSCSRESSWILPFLVMDLTSGFPEHLVFAFTKACHVLCLHTGYPPSTENTWRLGT